MRKRGILLTISLLQYAPIPISTYSIIPKCYLQTSQQQPLLKHRRSRGLHSFTSTPGSSISEEISGPVFQVLSYDGSIADTSEWRSTLAIEVALETWPHLQDYSNLPTDACSNDIIVTDHWLINKMCALSHVMMSDHEGIMGCDAVFLARLLLEEQLLDQGRSDGCKGKYGSKFHPSALVVENGRGKPSAGSRPLTVGEIASNWSDGACLKETLRAKFHLQGKDPLPVIKKNLNKKIDAKAYSQPKVHPFMKEFLSVYENKVSIILVGHTMHIPVALASLSKNSISVEVSASINDILESSMGLENRIFLVPSADGGQGHYDILQHLLVQAKCGSSIHFIHSSLETLLETKLLFGDNRPTSQDDGYGISAFGSQISLKLSLPTWADNTKLSQQNYVEMDAWMNLVNENEMMDKCHRR